MIHKLFNVKVIAAFATLLVSIQLAALDLDCSKFTSKNHPRLFFTEQGFKDLKSQVEKGENKALCQLHNSMMNIASKDGLSDKEIEFDAEKQKATFNGTARKISYRIISAAYAYRITGDKNYLNHVIWNIDTFADNFRRWTTNYWLENSELCLSFGLAYDWLYKELPKKTKDKMVKAIDSIGYDDAKDEKKAWFYNSWNNWNPVCNACLVCAAIGTYEKHPEESKAVINKAIETVPISLKGIFEPDGASPEGPSYWDYAANYEAILMMALNDAFGTDFGLSDYPGFKKAGDYRVFAVGNNNQYFNYADCNSGLSHICLPLWFYAWKYGRTDLLFRDVVALDNEVGVSSRALFMAIACAQRMGNFETKVPESLLYTGRGEANVIIARSGWGPDDSYLGFKGGKAKCNHSHLDEGSFVFEKNGVRWADEFPHPSYELYRRAAKAIAKEGKPKVPWYEKFVYGNWRHSTLTINDQAMNDNGFAPITDSFDTPERRGGTLDLSQMVKGQLESAFRTAAIVDGCNLEVVDELQALSDKSARVRFTLVTPADVELADNGITLRKNGKTVVLKANIPVEYKTWSSDPKDYNDSHYRPYESKSIKNPNNICGFEFDLSAGESVKLVTTIQ